MGLFSHRAAQVSALSQDQIESLKQEMSTIVNGARLCEGEAARAGHPVQILEIAIFDVMSFMVYMSNADGEILPAEVQAINDITGAGVDVPRCQELAKNIAVLGDAWTKNVPQSFVAIYNYMKLKADDETAYKLGLGLVGIYQDIGKAILTADGNADPSEIAAVNDYCAMLKRYLDEGSMG